jgi:peptidoglycan/LPS O-acetylase OafA/YrhL
MNIKKYFYSQPTFTSSTWALLAITRFFLALMVMVSLGHLNNFVKVDGLLRDLGDFGGKTAVIAFLMISGISIGYSFNKNKKGFLKRRFLRIYPLYFAAIFGTVILQFYLGSPYMVKDTNFAVSGYLTSIANFLLLQGIVAIDISYNGPVWSISVEAFLYLMLPLIFNLRLRWIYLIAIVSLTSFILHPYIGGVSLYGKKHLIYAWPFIVGFLIAVKRQFWCTIPIILVGAFGIYYSYLFELISEKYSFIWFFITFVLIVFVLYFKIDLSKKTKFLFNFLGTISFPMYLFHIPLYFLLYYLGFRESYSFVGLSVLLSIPIHYVFDVWLSRIFWKPVVAKVMGLSNVVFSNLRSYKPLKS